MGRSQTTFQKRQRELQKIRKREAKVIDDLTSKEGIILATGGGAVVNPQNRSHLGARGLVIYLYTTVEQQLSRTERGRHRPLLENGNRREILEALMQQRDPLYREIADLVIDTDGRKVKAVATEILDRL